MADLASTHASLRAAMDLFKSADPWTASDHEGMRDEHRTIAHAMEAAGQFDLADRHHAAADAHHQASGWMGTLPRHAHTTALAQRAHRLTAAAEPQTSDEHRAMQRFTRTRKAAPSGVHAELRAAMDLFKGKVREYQRRGRDGQIHTVTAHERRDRGPAPAPHTRHQQTSGVWFDPSKNLAAVAHNHENAFNHVHDDVYAATEKIVTKAFRGVRDHEHLRSLHEAVGSRGTGIALDHFSGQHMKPMLRRVDPHFDHGDDDGKMRDRLRALASGTATPAEATPGSKPRRRAEKPAEPPAARGLSSSMTARPEGALPEFSRSMGAKPRKRPEDMTALERKKANIRPGPDYSRGRPRGRG